MNCVKFGEGTFSRFLRKGYGISDPDIEGEVSENCTWKFQVIMFIHMLKAMPVLAIFFTYLFIIFR